jgi:hypothetical protein
VLTTSDIPAQDGACNIPTLDLLLRVACRQRTAGRLALPPEIVEYILRLGRQSDGWGMTREEAEIRRRQLMADRKVQAREVNGVSIPVYLLSNMKLIQSTAVGGRVFFV